MTWPNRIRLFIGLIAVFVIVGACTVVFNQRQSRAQSTSASIEAEQYDVGTTYGGTVVSQFVKAGDTVAVGDPLLAVQSLQLAHDLEDEVLKPTDLVATDPATGTYTVVATIDGTVADIQTPVGDFAPSGTVVATINETGSLTVSADFLLTPVDYGRIAEGTPVELTLPNAKKIQGSVKDIDVETVQGQAQSTITVASAALAAAKIEGLYKSGTPVVATLQLRDDGPLAGVTDSVREFFNKVGL